MRGFILGLFCLSAAVASCMAMGIEAPEEGGEAMMMMMMMMMFGDRLKKEKCPDPISLAAKLYGFLCDVEGCQSNAPICHAAMTPSGDMCEYEESCLKEIDGYTDKKEMMMMMTDCICEKMMASQNVEYVKGDMKGNTVRMTEATLERNENLSESAKTAVLNAIKENECRFSTEESGMKANMMFHLCLMKTCVRSMADPLAEP